MKDILLGNPYFTFLFGIFVIFINIISSIHFLPIMLIGILFLSFLHSLKNSYYYSLTYIVLVFLVVEYINGFLPFTFMLLSFFIYIFILPSLNRLISLNNLNKYIYILVFYLGATLIWGFTNDFNITLIGEIILNILIDFFIYGLFL